MTRFFYPIILLQQCSLLLILFSSGLAALNAKETVYQTPQDFLQTVFADNPPMPEVLWLTPELQSKLESIMGSPWPGLRVRYWRTHGRSAWILEAIGKEQPITTGIVIHQQQIEALKILIFRESRGWEVAQPFFTNQFKQAQLNANTNELSQTIDGISGATLSVRAVTKLAKVALFLNQQLPPPAITAP